MILATAGHVDHGKSTLVRLLTGTDPDRWEEEKRRGLTIDLGFAHLRLSDGRTLDVIDVPGHRRFVPNMLAGCGAVDLTLFVVSAREGWRAQSGEHLRILQAYGARGGVIALTHVDVTTDGRHETVMREVADRVVGTFLAGAPIVPTAADDGASIIRLRDALAHAAEAADSAHEAGPAEATEAEPRIQRPRLWVDRSFNVPGAGRVVTGTLTGGALRAGQDLSLFAHGGPSPRSAAIVRVRGLHRFGDATAEAVPGTRVGVNIVGAKVAPERGDALAIATQWTSARSLHVALLGTADGEPPSATAAYRVFVGTTHVAARVRYPAVAGTPFGGDVTLARVHLARPVGPIAPGDRLILRDDSHETTVAGGVVLAGDERSTRYPVEVLQRRFDALHAGFASGPHTSPERARRLAAALLDERDGIRAAAELQALVGSSELPGSKRVGDDVVDLQAIARRMGELESALARSNGAGVETADRIGRAAADLLVAAGTAVRFAGAVHRPEADPRAGARRDAVERARSALDATDPPLLTREELRSHVAIESRAISDLVRDGALVEVGSYVTTPERLHRWVEVVVSTIEATPAGATTSELRTALGFSRKYTVALLEWCDRRGLTARSGDRRTVV